MTESSLAGIRIAVYEDEGMQRRQLVRLLEEAGAVMVGEAATPDDFRRFAMQADFDVAILDIFPKQDLGNPVGLRIALWLATYLDEVGLLIQSVTDDESYVLRLLDKRARGVGYLVKSRIDDDAQLLQAVTLVHSGRNAFDSEVQIAMLQQRARGSEKILLSPAELKILALMAEALPTKLIADRARLSVSTVTGYISSIFRKLGLPSTSEADRGVNSRVAAVVHYMRSMEKYRIIQDVKPMDWPPPARLRACEPANRDLLRRD